MLGSGGEPLDIQRVARLESHRLVEDFMLLANQIVSTEAVRRRLPVLHRVHEPPTEQKVASLREFLGSLGQSLPKRTFKRRNPGAGARTRARATRPRAL